MKHWKLMTVIAIIIVIAIVGYLVIHDNKKDKLENDTKQSVEKGNKNSEINVVMFGDFKCPYCKEYDETVFKQLDKEYIQKGVINYRFVNLGFLGDDSKEAARAGQAIYNYSPKAYWKFHERLFEIQDKEQAKKDDWLTERVINREIDNLNIPKNNLDKIKKDYKISGSESWKSASKDGALKDKYHIKQVPTLYINGKKVKDVYDYKNVKQMIDKER